MDPSHSFPHPAIRKIIHVDMDAFFASVEQRDHPAWRGKPVVVGGTPEGRGVVCAASYEARRFGVHSAMPAFQAIKACPHAVFVKPRFQIYKEVSAQIREIFHDYTDQVEPLSLDEAYLDVTSNKKGIPSATWVAQDIKRRITLETGLTASAGVAPNKFLAKVASDFRKPNGLCVVTPEHAREFIAALPIEKFHGIGHVTAKRMHDHHIFTGRDLRNKSEEDLVYAFGKAGHFFFQIARGVDPRPVSPSRIRKSVSVERTFARDLNQWQMICQELARLCQELEHRMIAGDHVGRTVNLKVRFADFTTITRAHSSPTPQRESVWLFGHGKRLLSATEATRRAVRLLGIGVSNLGHGGPREIQLPLPLDLFGSQLQVSFFRPNTHF